ncbi:hypothetical protein [Bacillus cereus group sp. MYBK217-2]|uniref:hypothetical protein n=1 Tax=Bacillus cereus group sp. MYBK217-2 TaxID=3450661 RepID=UPI003F79FC61
MILNQKNDIFTVNTTIPVGTVTVTHDIPSNAAFPTFSITEKDKKVYYQGIDISRRNDGSYKVTYTFYNSENAAVGVELSYL